MTVTGIKVVYHDLLMVPRPSGTPWIYWLRLLRSGDTSLAVVTNVPGDPSGSSTNRIETVAEYVQSTFHAPSMRLFDVWPRRAREYGEPRWCEVPLTDINRRWPETSRAQLEEEIGVPLPDLPSHDELYRRVIALGGGTEQEVYVRVFEAFPVERLPPPHLPARCAHLGRFHEIEAALTARFSNGIERSLEAGRCFLATLTPVDLAACPRHAADWKAIADESVRILAGSESDGERLAEAVRSALPEVERRWLVSLFDDPVRIGGDSYSNGQHRGCALRFSGAQRAAINVRDEATGIESTDWTYLGEG